MSCLSVPYARTVVRNQWIIFLLYPCCERWRRQIQLFHNRFSPIYLHWLINPSLPYSHIYCIIQISFISTICLTLVIELPYKCCICRYSTFQVHCTSDIHWWKYQSLVYWLGADVASILSGRTSQCVRATCTCIVSTHISADGYEQGSKKIIRWKCSFYHTAFVQISWVQKHFLRSSLLPFPYSSLPHCTYMLTHTRAHRQAGNQQPYRQTYFTDRISCQSPSIIVQRSSLELLMQQCPSPLNPSKSFDHAAQCGGLSVLFLICLIYYAGQSDRVVTGSAHTLLKLTWPRAHHLITSPWPCYQVKSNSVSASFASLMWRPG